MKSTGIVRKVDELGRIVLPIELRRTLDINEKDPLEIFVDGGSIILKRYEPACIFAMTQETLSTTRAATSVRTASRSLPNARNKFRSLLHKVLARASGPISSLLSKK